MSNCKTIGCGHAYEDHTAWGCWECLMRGKDPESRCDGFRYVPMPPVILNGFIRLGPRAIGQGRRPAGDD